MTQIPAGWEETTLGERAEAMFSWGTPSTLREEYYSWEIPWVRTQEVNFNYINKTEVNITELGLKNSSAKWIKKNTVIIAIYWNSAWRVAYSNIDATTNQACCNFFGNKSCDNKFVFFNLMNRYKEILWMANWAAQQNLSVTVLKQLPIHLPPLPEQQAIAAVLSSFDDKIELLRAENQTLEQMGQELFKERFGSPLAPWRGNWDSLFTSWSKEKSPLGDLGVSLPEGWRVGKLGEIAEITSWKRPSEISDTRNSLFEIALIWATKIMGYVQNFLFDGETLVIGRVWTHWEVQIFYEKIHPSDNTLVIKSNNFYFTYFILKSIDYEKINRGAVQPLITQSDLKNYLVILPDQETLSKFDLVIKPLFNKIRANSEQIQTLSATRDQLLPKLMSWEVRVEL